MSRRDNNYRNGMQRSHLNPFMVLMIGVPIVLGAFALNAALGVIVTIMLISIAAD